MGVVRLSFQVESGRPIEHLPLLQRRPVREILLPLLENLLAKMARQACRREARLFHLHGEKLGDLWQIVPFAECKPKLVGGGPPTPKIVPRPDERVGERRPQDECALVLPYDRNKLPPPLVT